MATLEEWKQAFIKNITGGNGMIKYNDTMPDILRKHDEAIDRLEANERITVEVANLLARQMGYTIEFHAVASDNLGKPKLDTVVKLRPIYQAREMAAQQAFDRTKFTANIFDDVRTPYVSLSVRIDKSLETLDKCAAHYLRMLSWVSANKIRWAGLGNLEKENPCHKTMRDAIGESWDAASCPCCQEYLKAQPTTCSSPENGRCPLSFGDIPSPKGCCNFLYARIGGARTWQEWEVAANGVLGYIKSVRDGVLFARSIL